MTNKTKTPRSEVLKMHELYQKRVPVETIAEMFGVTRPGVYWLFNRENLTLKRPPWKQIAEEKIST